VRAGERGRRLVAVTGSAEQDDRVDPRGHRRQVGPDEQMRGGTGENRHDEDEVHDDPAPPRPPHPADGIGRLPFPGMEPVPADPAPDPVRRPSTWWWFLVPLLTCGLGSPVMVLIGGARLRSKAHLLAGIGYLLLGIYFFVTVQYTRTNGGHFPDAAVMPAFLAVWLGGVTHTVVLQMKVRERADPAPAPPPAAPADPALAAARQRAQRRQEARAILGSDPALAAELRIGRPDVPRQYDDGGLVDVNHVAADVLVAQLDMPAGLAASVVAERERLGGFGSADELVVYCEDMTPDRLQIIRDRLVFIPR
jgi:hypothetical protein